MQYLLVGLYLVKTLCTHVIETSTEASEQGSLVREGQTTIKTSPKFQFALPTAHSGQIH